MTYNSTRPESGSTNVSMTHGEFSRIMFHLIPEHKAPYITVMIWHLFYVGRGISKIVDTKLSKDNCSPRHFLRPWTCLWAFLFIGGFQIPLDLMVKGIKNWSTKESDTESVKLQITDTSRNRMSTVCDLIMVEFTMLPELKLKFPSQTK